MSIALAAPFLLAETTELAKIVASLLLATSVIVCLVYRFRGIAAAAKTIVYLLIMGFGIGFSLALSLSQSSDLSASKTETLAIIIVVVLVVGFNLPKRAGVYTKAALRKASVHKIPIAESSASSQRAGGPEQMGTPFAWIIGTRFGGRLGRIPHDPPSYSIDAISLRARRARLVVGLACSLFFFVAVLIVLFFEESQADVPDLESWVFWLLIAALLASLFGATLMLLGFARGIVATLAVVGACLLIDYIYRQIGMLVGSYPFALFIMVSVVGFALGYALRQIVGFRAKRQYDAFVAFEENESLFFVDLLFLEIYHVADFDHCIKATVTYDRKASQRDLQSVSRNLIRHCITKRLIFVGATLDPTRVTCSAFFYCPESGNDKRLRRFFRSALWVEAEVSSQFDPGWNTYRTALAPSDSMLIKLDVEQLIAWLGKRSFDFNEPHPIVLGSEFASQQDARTFINAINMKTYDEVRLKENLAESTDMSYSKTVFVQKTISVNAFNLHAEIRKFSRLTKQSTGWFLGIQFTSLKDLLES
ncbi:MAG: hypothetical protein FWD45_06835 [Coriobacteriia bacterium]|nr:hypothetical protein [Coriobacteriia bacterium]